MFAFHYWSNNLYLKNQRETSWAERHRYGWWTFLDFLISTQGPR